MTNVELAPDVFGWLTADATFNEAAPQVCGWCGRLVRWSVPADHADHSWGRCVGREPPDDDERATRGPYHGRVSVLVLSWKGDVSGDEIRRLSRAWAAQISEKPVLAHVHVNTYGTIEAS